MIESYTNKRALMVVNGLNCLDTSQSFIFGARLQDLLKGEVRVSLD
jgi:hypothetical protein